MKSFVLPHLTTFIAGALYALAYPSEFGEGWFPLLFIALPLFLWRLEEAPFKRSLGLIFLYNLGLGTVGYYWIPHTLREFGQLPYVISVVLGIAFALILQPHWWLYALFKRKRPDLKWFSESGILLTAICMTLLERYFPQQFPSYVGSPWLHLAPYLGLTPWFGVVAFSFMTFWVSLEVVAQLKLKKLRIQVWVVLAGFVILNAASPLKMSYGDKKLSVRVVQPNIGNFIKISSEQGDAAAFQQISDRYYGLSTTLNNFKPELIVWPETAYPNSFYGTDTQLESVFTRIMQDTGSEMLIGGYEMDITKGPGDFIESVFNSSIFMSDGQYKTAYHKNILIPFGETLPFGPFNRQVISIVPAISLFARGDSIPLMQTRDQYRFVTPICYEILESNYMRSLLNRHGKNQFIVNHTNDSWYGDTAEPLQHLFLSKWRALEFLLPIVRSTNTGITSIIYPDGSESPRLPIGAEDILDVEMPLSSGEETKYQQWGVLPTLLMMFIFLLTSLWREKKKIRP